jgi:hypothetical protein
MKRLLGKLWRHQDGVAMLMVLGFMAMSIPIVIGYLALAGTLVTDSEVKHRILVNQYASQACSQYAAWLLNNDPDFVESFLIEPEQEVIFEGCTITIVAAPPTKYVEDAYADLVLVLDNSWSISDSGNPSELDQLKDAANTIVDQFSLDITEGRVRIGAAKFHETSAPVVSMTDTDDHGVSEPLHAGINSLSWCFWPSSCWYETNIVSGINQGAAQFATGLGDRVDPPFPVPNLMIFITDGNDNQGNSLTDIENASLATGAEIFAVGVGSGVDINTLNAIATDPDPDHVFTTEDFDTLLDIINAIVLAIYNAAGTLFTITTVGADGTVVVSQVFIQAP